MKITTTDADICDISNTIGAAQAVASAAIELLPCRHDYTWQQQNRLSGLLTALEILLMVLENQSGVIEAALEKAA